MIGIMNIFILLPRLALFINIFLIYTIVYNALFKFLKIDQKKNILPFENQYNIYLQFFNSKIAQTIVILTIGALLIEFIPIFSLFVSNAQETAFGIKGKFDDLYTFLTPLKYSIYFVNFITIIIILLKNKKFK